MKIFLDFGSYFIHGDFYSLTPTFSHNFRRLNAAAERKEAREFMNAKKGISCYVLTMCFCDKLFSLACLVSAAAAAGKSRGELNVP